MTKDQLKITANYSFWKHPVKWIKEYKTRKLLSVCINHYWNMGGKEKVQALTLKALIEGTVIVRKEDLL